jgi:glutamine synthetase
VSLENVEKLIKDHKVEFVDLRFTDVRGVQHHVTFPKSIVDASLFEDGKMFDGSSISGWKGINESDMVLLPDASTAIIDPFTADPTLILTCDILDPATMQAYCARPARRGQARRGLPEVQRHRRHRVLRPGAGILHLRQRPFANEMGHTFFHVDSEEAAWNSGREYEGGNTGYRPGVKGGYFPVAPLDSLHDIRAEMCKELEAIGIEVEVHHHEVANAGQCEIGTKFNTLVQKADELLSMKYIIKNVAHRNGKTATFMPKPIVGDNGSGMHVHSRWPRTARTCSPATATVACRRWRCGTSAASSSTPARSTPSPTRPPTATSAWCRASRRR